MHGTVHRTDLSPSDLRVLRALPRDLDPGRWMTPAMLSDALSVAEDASQSILRRLVTLGLVEHDGERPRGYARTIRAEFILEHAIIEHEVTV